MNIIYMTVALYNETIVRNIINSLLPRENWKYQVIQDGDGYKNLSVIINDIIQHKRFSLSKEVLSVLDRFRMLGNLSAHKIQYNAKRRT